MPLAGEECLSLKAYRQLFGRRYGGLFLLTVPRMQMVNTTRKNDIEAALAAEQTNIKEIKNYSEAFRSGKVLSFPLFIFSGISECMVSLCGFRLF
jgi:hypothetical protein